VIHTDALIAEHFERLAEGRSATAFHEAGHAVAYVWFGLDPGSVSIVPTFRSMGSAGNAQEPRPVSERDGYEAQMRALEGRPIPAHVRDWVESYVVVCYAGGYATTRAVIEGIAADVPPLPEPTTDAEEEVADMRAVVLHNELALAADEAGEPHVITDDEQARNLLRAVSATNEEAEAWSALLRERTKFLIRQPVFWTGVRRVAESLMERETLDGDEIRRIVAEVQERWDSPPGRED
jgi:hypothetical protein